MTHMCATWLIHAYALARGFSPFLTHSYVVHHPRARHNSLICETKLIDMWDITHWYVSHDADIGMTWLIHACDMTHSCVRHDLFMRATWLIHVYAWARSFCPFFVQHFQLFISAAGGGHGPFCCRRALWWGSGLGVGRQQIEQLSQLCLMPMILHRYVCTYIYVRIYMYIYI